MVNTEKREEEKVKVVKPYRKRSSDRKKKKRHSLQENPQRKRKNPSNNRQLKGPEESRFGIACNEYSSAITNHERKLPGIGNPEKDRMVPFMHESVKMSDIFLCPFTRIGDFAR
jgi:hypothetical protein